MEHELGHQLRDYFRQVADGTTSASASPPQIGPQLRRGNPHRETPHRGAARWLAAAVIVASGLIAVAALANRSASPSISSTQQPGSAMPSTSLQGSGCRTGAGSVEAPSVVTLTYAAAVDLLGAAGLASQPIFEDTPQGLASESDPVDRKSVV